MSATARGKWAIARYGLAIAVVLALLGVAALGGAWQVYRTPPTQEVTEPVDEQRFATAMATEVVASGETGLYDRGETLRNRPVYFYNSSGTVTVRALTDVPADRQVVVSQRLVLRHVAARNGEPFFEERRVLAAANGTVNDGDAAVTTTLDVAAVRERVAERRSTIGGVGTFRTELRYHVEYRTDTASGTLQPTTGIVLTDRAYWFSRGLAANETHVRSDTRTVTEPPNLVRTGLYGALGAGLLLLAVGVGTLARREFDLDTIETEITRSRYGEWISRGEIPTGAEKEYIRIDGLEDLVDIAIDSSKRVIHDERYDTYGVVDGDVVYYYAQDDDEFGAWLDI